MAEKKNAWQELQPLFRPEGIAVVGASLAYFTDTKSAMNTFTVGNVKIELLESQYHRVNAGISNEKAKGQTEPLSGGYLWAANVDMQGTTENTPNYVTSGETWGGQYFSDAQIEAAFEDAIDECEYGN